VDLSSATYNSGRTVLVVEALRQGDLDLLGRVMDDRLHQPYRLPLIPGAQQALQAARAAGASGVALSGAGPSLIAFALASHAQIAQAMVAAFAEHNLKAVSRVLWTTSQGASSTSPH
jgi:homoserine kinase